MDDSRRSFLGTAAFGVGGLIALGGATLAYHDPDDIRAMPAFTRSLDGSRPKVTSGGWAKESTEHQLPIMKGLAGVHMLLDPGASCELHWHAIAPEWTYVIDGHCQTVVLDSLG